MQETCLVLAALVVIVVCAYRLSEAEEAAKTRLDEAKTSLRIAATTTAVVLVCLGSYALRKKIMNRMEAAALVVGATTTCGYLKYTVSLFEAAVAAANQNKTKVSVTTLALFCMGVAYAYYKTRSDSQNHEVDGCPPMRTPRATSSNSVQPSDYVPECSNPLQQNYIFFYMDSRMVEAYIAVTEPDCDLIVKKLLERMNSHRALGFDCEWRPQFVRGPRNRVALLQLATGDGYCGLFHLCQMNGVPDSLKSLLEDETIYKVGVQPDNDALYLYQDYGVELKSTFDVRHLAVLSGHKASLNLGALSNNVLGISLGKSKAITCSDWGADYLSLQQAKYAAMDAYAGIRIFVKLVIEYHRRKRQTATAPYSIDIDLVDIYLKYVDVNFKTKRKLTY